MDPIPDIPLSEIEAARARLQGVALRTPLVRLNVTDAPAEIHLKLENLQPIGAFKIRGAGNATRRPPSSRPSSGWAAPS
jgi:threonine dehydratase